MSKYNTEQLLELYGTKYDSESFSKRNFEKFAKYFKLLDKKFALKHRKTMIDLGCGSGVKTAAFAQFFDTCTAVDLSPGAISKAKQLIKDDRIDFVCADLFTLDKQKHDLITAFGFSYFNEESEDVLAAKIHKIMQFTGNEHATLIISSFTNFSGTAPSGWVMHSKEQLNDLLKKLKEFGYQAELYFPESDVKNYFGFGMENFVKETVRRFSSRKRTFFLVVRNSQ